MTPELVPVPRGALIVPSTPPSSGRVVRLSLIIPTYNESKSIRELIEQLERILQPALGDSYELIVVDDDSPDRTWAIAQELAATHPNLRVMRRVGERGLSTAVVRGWQVANGEILGVMDADLQHPAEVNVRLLEEIDRGAGLAAASRHIEGGGVSDWSIPRRILSRGAQLFGLLVLPEVLGRLSDPMSGYFMVRRSSVAEVALDPLGYKILIEVVARGKIRWIGEVGYVFRERSEGESKVTWQLYLQYFVHLAKLRLALGSRFLRFAIVGTSGVFVDTGFLYLLSDPGMLGLGLTRSKTIAAEIAIISNFTLNDLWTFRDAARSNPGMRARLRRFLGFNAVCLVGLLMNLLLLNALYNWVGINRYVANLIAIAIVTAWNYWLNKKLNWAPLRVGSDEPR